MPEHSMSLRRIGPSWRIAIGVVVAALLSTACSHARRGDLAAYCTALNDQRALLVLPVAGLTDVDQIVGRYRKMAEQAPLDIRPQWDRLAALLQKAATIDITDPAARLTVVQQAYETQNDSTDIVNHAQTVCGVALDISGTTTTTTTTTSTTIVAATATTAPAPASSSADVTASTIPPPTSDPAGAPVAEPTTAPVTPSAVPAPSPPAESVPTTIA